MPESLDVLITRLDVLVAELVRAEAGHADVIDAVCPRHRRGAVNLVHYATLRQQDLRALQNDLMDVDVTPPATTEAHVQAKVQAARTKLAALREVPGQGTPRRPTTPSTTARTSLMPTPATSSVPCARGGRPRSW